MPGEAETHTDKFPFPELMEQEREAGVEYPENLVIEGGSMRDQVERAVAVLTISSTALLEGIAAGVPVLAITDFGISGETINTVFKGSGLYGSFRDAEKGRFAHPDPVWAKDNYFHDPSDDSWIGAIEQLLDQRATEGLPRYRSVTPSPIGYVRRFVYRRAVFVPANGETRVQKAFLAAGRAIVRSPQLGKTVARRIGL